MKTKLGISIVILLCLIICSCNESTITDNDNTKRTYTINKAVSGGENWELSYSLPTQIGSASNRLTDYCGNEGGDIFVSTTTGGVYKIDIIDSTSTIIKNGLTQTSDGYNYVGCILYNNNSIIVGSTNLDNLGGIYVSKEEAFENKVEWSKYSNIVSLAESPNGNIFAGCYEDILVSDDNGDSWTNLSSNTEEGFTYFYNFAFDKYANIYGATRKGVYYSDSQQMEFKCIGLSEKVILGIDLNSKGWVYVSTEDGKMFYSNNNGQTWEELVNYHGKQAKSVYINSSNYIFTGGDGGVNRSKDNGESWELVGLESTYVERVKSDNNGNLIVGTYMNNIYISKN